jgi:uncharacterized membrane protein YeaQ/YmgE (transglycosylase-associated protein family)
MGILVWIVCGFFAGLIARALVPGPSGSFTGCLPTIVLGIIGSVVGGFIGQGLGWYPSDRVHFAGFIMSTVGAIIVLVIYGALAKRNAQ